MNNKSKEILRLEKEIMANELLYRSGKPEISDIEFDNLKESLRKLDPSNHLLTLIVGESFLGKLVKLPHPMGSLINIRNNEELYKWLESSRAEFYVVMPKLDGISSTREKYGRFISRGDGSEFGTDISKYCIYFDKMNNQFQYDCRGEIVISRKNFIAINEIRVSQGLDPYKTERSAVVGMMQSEKPDIRCLMLFDFIPYTILGKDFDKNGQLLELNANNKANINWKVLQKKNINHETLSNLFYAWSEDYEIDGLVIEANDSDIRLELGFETNSYNPKYGRAYKVGFEEEKSTIVTGITQQIGKNGSYTPVINIEPITLCGNTISNINGDNERFLLWYGIGIGSEVTLKKSGNVIPRLTKVEKFKILPFKEFNAQVKGFDVAHGHLGYIEFQNVHAIDSLYTPPSFEYVWDENHVNIMKPVGVKNIHQEIKKIGFFFSNLGIMNVGDSLITSLYQAGFDTIPKILKATDSELLALDNFGTKKLDNFKSEIHKRLAQASLEKLMHSSGYFENVGETKLKLIGFSIEERKELTFDSLCQINGIGEVMATTISKNIKNFLDFYDEIKHRITKTEKSENKGLDGQIICFTGFRDKQMVEVIVENGGEYKDSINKTVTILVYDDNNGVGKSTKIVKAEKDGIRTMTKADFKNMLDKFGFVSSINNINNGFEKLNDGFESLI